MICSRTFGSSCLFDGMEVGVAYGLDYPAVGSVKRIIDKARVSLRRESTSIYK